MDTNALLQRQEMELYTDQLVNNAEKTISKKCMGERKLKLSQLSNLLAVSLETNSPAAIANWIRYQMGRKETRYAWDNTGLGKSILENLQEMSQWAQDISRKLYGDKVKTEQIMTIYVGLIQQYVGYLRRWYVAKGGQN